MRPSAAPRCAIRAAWTALTLSASTNIATRVMGEPHMHVFTKIGYESGTVRAGQ
ncbi:hypothetical protein STA1M1_36630 [Sinisalibacter aestuarii]|uniref:Uncharacterized protein n=1 Tax=Sinisalibacter aestuarii TaxID=2949426 RepID=A0ABQ5LXU9_9RHOB|nr:hypothetical protein STA1M1_36630 [Sinisalibacter aestuarii]